MPFRRLHPFAIAAIVCVFLAANVQLNLLTRAADPAPTAHEPAVLDRIFANWKARHDRVHSVHFTMDCRTTYRKGSTTFQAITGPLV